MGPSLGNFFVCECKWSSMYVSSLCAENKSCKIDAISPIIEYYDPVKDKQTEDSNKNKPINETSQIILHKDTLEVNPGKWNFI